MAFSLQSQHGSSEEIANYWLRQYEMARSDRAIFDSHFDRAAQRFFPEAEQFQSWRTPGDRRRQFAYSSLAYRTLKKWVSWMVSLTAPKTAQYQRYKASEEELNKDKSVKEFFEVFTRRIFRVRNAPRADFYGALTPMYFDRGVFGNGCFFVDETNDSRLVKYTSRALSRVYIQVDHEKRVTTIFYRATLSAAAAHTKWHHIWGENPPAQVKRRLEKDPWSKMDFLHVVTPRKVMDPFSMGPERMPWASYYISCEDRSLIEKGGYHEMPYIFGREPTLPNENYGRGAGMMLLPESDSLNAMWKTHLFAGERRANPPVLISEDAVLGRRVVDLRPGGANRGFMSSDGRPLMAPFDTGARLDISAEMIKSMEDAIIDGFGINLMRILFEDPQGNATATEVLKRAQEKADLIAPTANSLQAEVFGPESERLVGILGRADALPELPQALIEAGAGYEIEHIAPVNQLQRSGEIAASREMVAELYQIAQFKPEEIHRLNVSEYLERLLEVQGGPPQLLRSEDDFQAIVQQIQQAQAQEAQLAQAQQAASAAKDGSQALRVIDGGA